MLVHIKNNEVSKHRNIYWYSKYFYLRSYQEEGKPSVSDDKIFSKYH